MRGIAMDIFVKGLSLINCTLVITADYHQFDEINKIVPMLPITNTAHTILHGRH